MGRVETGFSDRDLVPSGYRDGVEIPTPRPMAPTGQGRVGTGFAKICQEINNYVKSNNYRNTFLSIRNYSYLILSISLFGFSVVTSLGLGTVGKGRDGKSQLWSRPDGTSGTGPLPYFPSRFPTGPGLPTGWSRSLGKPKFRRTLITLYILN